MKHTTPFADINALLDELLASVQSLLGNYFVGMYVHGSLAGGDFAPERSDVDILVVTADDLPTLLLTELKAMHTRITGSANKWARKLEVSYIPQAALRRYDPARSFHPALRIDGSFDIDGHGSEWVFQRHIIRQQGIVLYGPNPQTLIDPISPQALQDAVQGILQSWWLPQLTDHSRLQRGEYQAYAVLTMCRSLFTWKKGAVGSKTAAVRWAKNELNDNWTPLIEEALGWKEGDAFDRLEETLNLMRYTFEQCGLNKG